MITRVDFYLLATTQNINLILCRLVEKAYHRQHRIFLACNNKPEAKYLNDFLWTFQEDAFIPHNLEGENTNTPVKIGFSDESYWGDDILINMKIIVPAYFKKFQRIIEIVANNEEAKKISRQHYREYRQNQCEIYTHNLGNV